MLTSRRALAGTVLAAAVIGGAAQMAAAHADATTDRLAAGQTLGSNGSLVSPTGQNVLDMQTDGNVVVYGYGRPIWSSSYAPAASSRGSRLVMQTDGNLVEYSPSNAVVWSSGTAGSGSSNYLAVQDDGNLVVYTSAGRPVWQSGSRSSSLAAGGILHSGQSLTSSSGSFQVVMQTDGNLVLYKVGKGAIWSSGTAGSASGGYAAVQADGNFVVYSAAGSAVWQTGSAGRGNASTRLIMQTDGNLVLYSVDKALWATNTAPAPVRGQAIVNAAEKWLGTPYVWDGGGPNGPSNGGTQNGPVGFDCSGLTEYAVFQVLHIDITHYTVTQFDDSRGVAVDRTQLQPGDLVFFYFPDADDVSPGHVGIYVGNGQYVNAPTEGENVQIQNVQWDRMTGAKRFGS